MTEFIVRLTDAQERFIRNSSDLWIDHYTGIGRDLCKQVKEAIQLYDQLVAEAKAASDE